MMSCCSRCRAAVDAVPLGYRDVINDALVGFVRDFNHRGFVVKDIREMGRLRFVW